MSAQGLPGAALVLSNASFELPVTPFVSTEVVGWQKTPQPPWYPEDEIFLWDQLTGLFKNPDPNTEGHILNCDGQQAAWLFAVPEVGLFQDVGPQPCSFGVFEPGKSYELTVGIIGLGGGMREGATLELGVYYRDPDHRQVMVATTTLTNGPPVFSNRTHFADFKVQVPTVRTNDPWAGRPIGARFLSTVSFDLQGGYWVLDHVRLDSFGPPVLTAVRFVGGQLHFTLTSDPGQRFDLLASANVTLPLAQWARVGILTNVTGCQTFSVPAGPIPAGFYRLQLLD